MAPSRPKPTPDAEVLGPELAFEVTLSPQTRLVWKYLKGGRKLTQLIALNNLGIGSLTSRVSELRKALALLTNATHEVVDEWKKDHSGQRYKSYSLVEKQPGAL